jgi:hypothetical protein
VQVLRDYNRYAELLKAAESQGNRNEELLTRSRLFQACGVSLDTSWQPNFAIERSLSALKSKGLLAAGSMHRVAVIGPGLDFTDKNEGYDFYPPQSIRGSPAGRETFHREFRLNFSSCNALSSMCEPVPHSAVS